MISGLLTNLATGSTTATPTTGSAAADYLTALPATAVRMVAGFLGAIGS